MRFVRYVGEERCTANEYKQAIRNDGCVLIDRVSALANTTMDFRLDGRPATLGLLDGTLDFLDLGAIVYLADEMVDRAQTSDYWTRSIRCLVPVADPELWHSAESDLMDTLSLLSGDWWQFDFCRLDRSVPLRPHRQGLPDDCDAVCLFSGGTDSLLGAISLLESGRKVLLVGHQAERQAASAQRALAAMLRELYPNQLHLLQCSMSRSVRRNTEFGLAPKTERSHRPRSFLFLTLGVAAAAKCGIDDVFMPENGLMTLNIPLQKSRTGALSTRTTHPLFMLRFLKLARDTVGFNGSIRNPFITQSKTDLLRNLPSVLRPLLVRSNSCSRPSRFNYLRVRHCGYCVPCIHRRIALMEAQLDSAGDYAFDVFEDFVSLPRDKQQDFRAVVRFAERVASASTAKLQTLILSQGYFPSDAGITIGVASDTGYSPWVEMLRRWATDFLSKIGNEASSDTLRALGLSSDSER